jgi:RNA polymerase sigma-70 factor (ECF subfamily)
VSSGLANPVNDSNLPSGPHKSTRPPRLYDDAMSDRPPDDARSLVGRLYDTYGASLYRYAALLLADATAAEDVVQQVFTSILRKGPRLDEEAHYLRRAVRNECYSHLRRRRKHAEVGHQHAVIEPVVDSASAEERIALERAIRELAPEQREVIYLHVFEGLTFQEVATSLDASINTVAARYRYALERLRTILTSGQRE